MRYYVTIGREEPALIEVETIAPDRYRVTANGQSREVDARIFADRGMSMLVGFQSYSAELENFGDQILVHLGGKIHAVDVANERRFRLRRQAAKFSLEGKQVVAAPMPGKVTKVLVRLGEEVKEGQGLVVIEAMKMENELKSPKSGKVAELLAVEGSAVEKNAPLVAVE